MSKIEWTGQTWNPIVGCSLASPGCTNCYAMKMAARLQAMAGDGLDDNGYAVRGTGPLDHYRNLTKPSKAGPVWTGKMAQAPDATLMKPLERKKPTTYFVNSMSDLFHEDVPDAWIDRVFAVMALSPQHTLQVLTKRSARMRAYLSEPERSKMIAHEAAKMDMNGTFSGAATWGRIEKLCREPLPNVWFGVSCEDQRRADERVPDLLATPAAVRFVSAEPLLGPIDFTKLFDRSNEHAFDALAGRRFYDPRDSEGEQVPRLDWIIVGGESGASARPMHPQWARAIRDQCTGADAGGHPKRPGENVAFFFKQWGAWLVGEWQTPLDDLTWQPDVLFPDGTDFAIVSDWHDIVLGGAETEPAGPKHLWREFWGWQGHLIKKASTKSHRLLDGREWNEYPAPRPPAPAAQAATEEVV